MRRFMKFVLKYFWCCLRFGFMSREKVIWNVKLKYIESCLRIYDYKYAKRIGVCFKKIFLKTSYA